MLYYLCVRVCVLLVFSGSVRGLKCMEEGWLVVKYCASMYMNFPFKRVGWFVWGDLVKFEKKL